MTQDRSDTDEHTESPLLLVKLTGYKLLNMLVISAFGIAKAILTYQGLSAVPTTLDWILGVVLTIMCV